jgi:hypothetical protein
MLSFTIYIGQIDCDSPQLYKIINLTMSPLNSLQLLTIFNTSCDHSTRHYMMKLTRAIGAKHSVHHDCTGTPINILFPNVLHITQEL